MPRAYRLQRRRGHATTVRGKIQIRSKNSTSSQTRSLRKQISQATERLDTSERLSLSTKGGQYIRLERKKFRFWMAVLRSLSTSYPWGLLSLWQRIKLSLIDDWCLPVLIWVLNSRLCLLQECLGTKHPYNNTWVCKLSVHSRTCRAKFSISCFHIWILPVCTAIYELHALSPYRGIISPCLCIEMKFFAVTFKCVYLGNSSMEKLCSSLIL